MEDVDIPAEQCDGPCHDPVNYHFYSTDRGWAYCPWCGKPMEKEEK